MRFEINGPAAKRVSELAKKVGADDPMDVVRWSLAVYDFLITHEQAGWETCVVDPADRSNMIRVLTRGPADK